MKALQVSASVFFLAAATTAIAADPATNDNIIFEKNIDYANPDEQHLQLNLARLAKSPGLCPAILCIHGGGFRAGDKEGYNGLCA